MKPDLNLLVVLDALCRTGSVSRASESLALSQPAISHALNRLRAATGDPLFTRSGRGLVPTPRAQALAEQVAGIVAAGQACLRPEAFDPAKDAPRFRLGVSDYAAMVLLPQVVEELGRQAPFATVEAMTVGPGLLRQLEEGGLDLSFWGTVPPDPPFLHQPLFEERFLVALRQDHPALASGAFGLKDYLDLNHSVVSLGDPGQSPVDARLAQLGLRRRVGLVTSGFAASLASVAVSDLVATIPSRLARALPRGLVTRPLPLDDLTFRYGMIWHPRSDAAPSLRWLRGMIVSLMGEGGTVGRA